MTTDAAAARLRVLVITKIFPNAAEPDSAPFNRQQLGALAAHADLSILATIPWYPGAGLAGKWSSAAKLARVPARETIDGLDVRHPRTLFIPRIAHGLWAPLYAASVAPFALAYRGKVDVVLGTWAYPDGAAAVALAKLVGVPAVIKLHGSDMNQIGKLPGPRRVLRQALPRAARVVAVSRALADEARGLGVADDRIAIVMNGVDASLFHPRDRAAARAELGLAKDAKLALYVGNLKETKGTRDLAAAFDALAKDAPDVHLAIVGGGPDRGLVDALAQRHPGRVTVAGPRPLAEVPTWMAACDTLVLPSWAEGTPNVVLEALAAGRRVVGSSVGGIPDLLAEPALGELVPPRDPAALAAAIVRVARAPYDPVAIAARGARGGWADSARQQLGVLTDAVAEARG
ncbi:MAG: glycosyltransferase [Deltaproteobacteria bacterium]|nr:glycosyltransferase [Deltaproteobacteria bacterium]